MQLEMTGDRLERAFTSELGTAWRIASIVAKRPSITSSELDTLTSAMLPADTAVVSVKAATNNAVAWYFPKPDSRSLLGQKLLFDTEHFQASEKAIEKRTLVASGPSKDSDGGYSMHAWAAVFTNEKSIEKYWGLINATVDFGTVLEKAGLKGRSEAVIYALSVRDPRNPSKKSVFWGRKEILAEGPESTSVNLPELSWELSALPAAGWNRTAPADYLILLVGLLSAVAVIMIGLFSRGEDDIMIVDNPDSTLLLESVAREIDYALLPLAAYPDGMDTSPAVFNSVGQSVEDDLAHKNAFFKADSLAGTGADPARTSYWKLRRLFEELLETVSLEKKESKPVCSELDIRAMIADIAEFFAGYASTAHIGFQTSVEAVIPQKLYGDPDRLHRILFDLVGESLAFTEKGEVALSVILEDMGHGGAVLRFIIRDSGSDLDPSLSDRLFTAFNSVRGSAAKRFATTGLSMSLAGSLVHLLGGRLEYEPESGQGLMLRFTLGFSLSPQAISPRSAGEPETSEDDSSIPVSTETGAEVMVQPDIVTISASEPKAPKRWKRIFGNPRRGRTEEGKNIAAGSEPSGRHSGPTDTSGSREQNIPIATHSRTTDTSASTRSAPGSADQVDEKNGESRSAGEASPTEHVFDIPAIPTSSGEAREFPFKPRILLAEDGEVNRDIIMRMLKSRSFTADIATDGRQALAACLRNEYDIVFMDCMMPVMDGYESTARMRQLKGPGRPVIIGMTASVMESDRSRCFASGMDDVIAKPFTLDELVATIKKHSETD